jgi:xanthine dehydrogenase YagR molybdenum-binding subunit
VADNPQVPEVNTPARPPQHEKYPWPAEPTLIGKRIQRVDGPAKVTGQAKYSYDINRPGGLHGRILRSPHPHARIVSIDLAAAAKAPGVKAVLAVLEPGAKVMFQGEEVAALAAATEEQADDALRLIAVKYEVLPHIATEALAQQAGAPLVFKDGNIKEGDTEEAGDLDAGFKAAAHIVEASYATQVQTHVSLETHGCVCEWDGDKLTSWASTQAVHGTRDGFDKELDIPQANVRVITV